MLRRHTLLLILLLVAAAALFLTRRSRLALDEIQAPPTEARNEAPAGPPRPARPALPPDPAWIRTALDIMSDAAREERCGPYRLITDRDDEAFHEMCAALATAIDDLYLQIVGVAPIGEARGAVIAFRDRAALRRFLRAHTGLGAGYSAMTRSSRGIVAMAAVGDPATLAPTLAHEMAHLLHRRAFGPALQPWLSEGLADTVGDLATADGFLLVGQLSASTNSMVTRLRDALEEGVLRPTADLLELDRSEFDSATRSYDYEHSAVLVRYLLIDPDLRVPFLGLLEQLAAGAPYSRATVLTSLGLQAGELDRRFRNWLRATG